MKRILLTAALCLAMPMAGCSSPVPKHKMHKVKRTVYHFADGRTGYQSADGVWWFIVLQAAADADVPDMPDTSTTTRSSTSTSSTASRATSFTPAPGYVATGTWARGPAPAGVDLSKATPEEELVAEDAEGEPATTEEEATEAETATEATESTSEGGSEATSEGSSESGSSDAGSSDSGGGDSGGGGSE